MLVISVTMALNGIRDCVTDETTAIEMKAYLMLKLEMVADVPFNQKSLIVS